MKYSQETIKAILDLSANGLSSRDIAGLLEISKSGVNYALQRNSELQYDPRDVAFNSGPRVLKYAWMINL